MWAVIIPIIAALLPYLIEWLLDLLDKASKTVTPPSSSSNAREFKFRLRELFNVAERKLWRWQVGKKITLRLVKMAVLARAEPIQLKATGHDINVPSFTDDEATEIADADKGELV